MAKAKRLTNSQGEKLPYVDHGDGAAVMKEKERHRRIADAFLAKDRKQFDRLVGSTKASTAIWTQLERLGHNAKKEDLYRTVQAQLTKG